MNTAVVPPLAGLSAKGGAATGSPFLPEISAKGGIVNSSSVIATSSNNLRRSNHTLSALGATVEVGVRGSNGSLHKLNRANSSSSRSLHQQSNSGSLQNVSVLSGGESQAELRRVASPNSHSSRGAAGPAAGTTTSERRRANTAPFNGPRIVLPPSKSQAFIAIFEDAYEQISVLADIAPSEGGGGPAKLKAEKKTLENEVARIIQDQKHLELRYNELVAEQEALRQQNQQAHGKKRGNNKDQNNADNQQRNSNGRPVKKFSSHLQNVSKINAERSLLQNLVSKTIRELKGFRFETLIQTVEEEYRKKDILKNTIQREQEASQMVRKLKEELAREKQLLEEETVDRDQAISQLKDTIQEVKQLTTTESKYMKKESRAHEAMVKQMCQHKVNKLDGALEHNQKQQDLEEKAHQTIMDFLGVQREELDRQIQDWMAKYEQDTESKSQELESLKQRRTTDFERYEQLVQKYEVLEKKVLEDRDQKRKAEEARVLQEKRERAARKILRWLRKLKEASKASKGKKKGSGKPKSKGSGKASAKKK